MAGPACIIASSLEYHTKYHTIRSFCIKYVVFGGSDSRQQLVDSLVFTGLFSFCSALVNTYETVNGAEEPVARVTCPYCGREFTTDMDFKG